MNFPLSFTKILERIDAIAPQKYAGTRNFIDGAVTQLSPYISRGVISTKQVFDAVVAKGFEPKKIEKFIQELAWRDYWQQIWIAKQEEINEDLIKAQPTATRKGLPKSIDENTTGIEGIDDGIADLYKTGYMHNHVRMYVAAVACNVGKCHWKIPAQWLYYNLLDADWASNALSWQWVCGANSHRIYYANQENINRYCHTKQAGTFLDIPYAEFKSLAIPKVLDKVVKPKFNTTLPVTEKPKIAAEKPTLIYNFYNIDPLWRSDVDANRILLLEPSVFAKYPVSDKVLKFCIALAKENIAGIKIWVAEFADLKKITEGEVYFKEHPLNKYVGNEDARTWLTNVKGYYPSFFAFYKKARKELIVAEK